MNNEKTQFKKGHKFYPIKNNSNKIESYQKRGKKLREFYSKNKHHLKGTRFTNEHKKKISLAHKGKRKPWVKCPHIKLDKHWNWKGGKSFEPYLVDWTETLKRSIRERDNYICQSCSQYGNIIHHIDKNKQNCSPNNLITLCNSCHSKLHTGWVQLDN